MKEILGSNLRQFFDTIDNQPNNADITYAGDRYEVWEVSDKLFQKMCDMTEEEFVEMASGDAWWRSSVGSNLGHPNSTMSINGSDLKCWSREVDYYISCWSQGKEIVQKKYDSLSEYLCECIGASLPRNVCACAVDLAKYNDMTMGELFEKYEG